MFYTKAWYCTIICLMLGTFNLAAGDIASFIDLGFSPDNRTYMFAQYGVQSKERKAWADLFVVDIVKNNFVPGGRVSFVHNEPVVVGQDGAGALYQILAKNAALASRYNINYLHQGEVLYIAPEKTVPAPATEMVEFRNFRTGDAYRASIVVSVEGAGAALASSFYIDLERTSSNGTKKTYKIGTPQLKRPLVSSYRIKKIIISPKSTAVIMVIEMRKPADDNFDIRYMIEAVLL
jgi:predicted secreted protein